MKTRLTQYLGLLFVALLLISSTPVATVKAQEGPSTLYIPYMQQGSGTLNKATQVAEGGSAESEAVTRAREFFTTNESVKILEAIQVLRPLEIADEPAGLLSNPDDPTSHLLPPGINTVEELPKCISTPDDPATLEDEVQLEYEYMVKEGLYNRLMKWEFIACRAGSEPPQDTGEEYVPWPDPYDVHPNSPKNKPQGSLDGDAPASVSANMKFPEISRRANKGKHGMV